MASTTPTVEVTITVPVDLDLATELVALGQGGSPALARLAGHLASAILDGDERHRTTLKSTAA